MYVVSAFRRTSREVRLKPDTTYYMEPKTALAASPHEASNGRSRVQEAAPVYGGRDSTGRPAAAGRLARRIGSWNEQPHHHVLVRSTIRSVARVATRVESLTSSRVTLGPFLCILLTF